MELHHEYITKTVITPHVEFHLQLINLKFFISMSNIDAENYTHLLVETLPRLHIWRKMQNLSMSKWVHNLCSTFKCQGRNILLRYKLSCFPWKINTMTTKLVIHKIKTRKSPLPHNANVSPGTGSVFYVILLFEGGTKNLPPPPFPQTKDWRRDRRQCPGLLSTLGAASPKSYCV